MICLFIAKDVVFGVHSFECAVLPGDTTKTASGGYHNGDSLELRSYYDAERERQHPGEYPILAGSDSGRHPCLFPYGVYIICMLAA